MEQGCVQDTYTRFVEASFEVIIIIAEGDPQGLQNITTTTYRGNAIVPVLGYRNTSSSGDKGCQGRNIKGVLTVPPCTT